MDKDVRCSGVLVSVYAYSGGRSQPLLLTYTADGLASKDTMGSCCSYGCNLRVGRCIGIMAKSMARKILVEGEE